MITLEIVYSSYGPQFYGDVANVYCETSKYSHCISDGDSMYTIEEFRIEGYKYKTLII
jgi:hypothetical protein